MEILLARVKGDPLRKLRTSYDANEARRSIGQMCTRSRFYLTEYTNAKVSMLHCLMGCSATDEDMNVLMYLLKISDIDVNLHSEKMTTPYDMLWHAPSNSKFRIEKVCLLMEHPDINPFSGFQGTSFLSLPFLEFEAYLAVLVAGSAHNNKGPIWKPNYLRALIKRFKTTEFHGDLIVMLQAYCENPKHVHNAIRKTLEFHHFDSARLYNMLSLLNFGILQIKQQ